MEGVEEDAILVEGGAKLQESVSTIFRKYSMRRGSLYFGSLKGRRWRDIIKG